MKSFTNHKIKRKIYIKINVDVDTGEIIDEELFNSEYIKIKKNEYKIEYSRDCKITTRTAFGRINQQRTIW